LAARTSYVKIGIFVILGIASAFLTAIAIGVQRLHHETVSFYTYFNESVDGLDVTAPVRLRGVRIGQVGDITIAPDAIRVEVRCDIDVATMRRLSLSPYREIPPNLRTQLASQGLVSGAKYISIDYFDPKVNPPPELTFPTPWRYIPAARSVQKSLEESVTRAMDGLQQLVATLQRQGFSEKLVSTVVDADALLVGLDQTLKSVDRERLPARAAATLESLRATVGKAKGVLDRVDGSSGLLVTAQHSITALGDVGRNAAGATSNLSDAFGQVREAAEAIRSFIDEMERDPEMLLKGRGHTETRETP